MDLEETLDRLLVETEKLNERGSDLLARSGESRFIGQHGTKAGAEALAGGGGYRLVEPGRKVAREPEAKAGQFAESMTKALAEATSSAGGYLVPQEVAFEVMTLLRARSAVYQLGPTRVDVEKELAVTALSTGASASWVAENAPIPVSEQTFSQSVLLRPKDLGALVPVSLRLLRDAADNPSVEDVVKRDLAEVMALKADLAFISGTGTGQPLGILNHAGLTAGPSTGTDGRAASFDDLKQMVAACRALNAPFQRPGWLFNARLLASIELLKDADDRYLMDSGMLTYDATGASGRLLGYPFRTSSQISVAETTGSSTDTTQIVF